MICIFVSICSIAFNLAYNRNKLLRTLDYWYGDMLNFDFLEKCLGMVSSSHFVNDFTRKTFLKLCSINWPNFFVWLSLFLEILSNMCIAIVCFAGCDAINLEIDLIFLIKLFSYMAKKPRQNFKYLENEKSF